MLKKETTPRHEVEAMVNRRDLLPSPVRSLSMRWHLGISSFKWCFLYLLAIAAFASCCFAERTKTDIVYMRNGDKITCEIKSLSQGQLSVKPDYTNATIVIDWSKVARIESTQQFIVTQPDGALSYGALTGDEQSHTLFVVEARRTPIPHDSVVQISELGSSFLKRLRGNISVGTSFTQSNSQATLAVQNDITYQSKRYLGSLNWNSQFATQQKTNNTSETTVKSLAFRELRASNWYGGGIANFLSSSEQSIALQSTLGGAIARRLIFTNKTDLTGIGGIGYTVQRDSANTMNTGKTRTVDSAFAIQYSTFRFDSAQFNTTLWFYPSLSEPGRLRMTLNQDVYYKIIGNFYVSISFYDNYDSHPVVGAPANNLGASTMLGWSFP
jgi:hypothetical protein